MRTTLIACFMIARTATMARTSEPAAIVAQATSLVATLAANESNASNAMTPLTDHTETMPTVSMSNASSNDTLDELYFSPHYVRMGMPLSYAPYDIEDPAGGNETAPTVNVILNLTPMPSWIIWLMLAVVGTILGSDLFLTYARKVTSAFTSKPNVLGKPADVEDDGTRSTLETMSTFVLACAVDFTGELYYGTVTTFLPAESAIRNVDAYDVIIASHAVGALCAAPFASQLLRFQDPRLIWRCTTLFHALFALGCALSFSATGTLFALLLGGCRFFIGAITTVSSSVSQSLVIRTAPAEVAAGRIGTILLCRTLGFLLGPTVSGFLYPIPYGGYALPFVVPVAGLLAAYVGVLSLSVYTAPMPVVTTTASPMRVLRVWQTWPALLSVPMLGLFGQFSLEPLYAPIFAHVPYNLEITQIGLLAAVLPFGQMTGTLIGSNLLPRGLTSSNKLLAVGAIGNTIGYLLLARSAPTRTGSIQLAIGALALAGMGVGMCLPTNALYILRVMEKEAGLTKREVGGTLATISVGCANFGALLAPIIGVEITEATDFGSYAVIWACTYAVTLIACVYFLWPYGYVNVLPAPAAAPAKAA